MTAARVSRAFVDFLRNEEQGSATLWNLCWLISFGTLMGLGIDTTAAMNTRARLQTVSDVAAHAGAMDLFPYASDAIDTALAYSAVNNPDHPGAVTADDVTIGYWDRDTRTFETEGIPEYNAVRVIATRDTSRANALRTTFLSLVGLHDWDIRSGSTALYYDDLSLVDRCRKEGLLAGGQLEQTANNIVIGQYCLHGEGGVNITQNNHLECGVEISLPDPSLWLSQSVPTPSGMEECNEDYDSLSSNEMVQQVVIYRSVPSHAQLEYDNVKEILDAYIAAYYGGEPINDFFNAIPPYITHVTELDVAGFNSIMTNGNVEAGKLYRVNCWGSSTKLRMTGIVRNVGIYTDCEIDVRQTNIGGIVNTTGTPPPNHTCAEALDAGYARYQTLLDTAPGRTYRDGVTVDMEAEECGIEPGATGLWDNVFLFTTSPTTISFPSGMQIGRFDGCREGGATRLYTAGGITSPARIFMHGSQFIVLGDAKLAAQGSAYGMVVDAKGNIQYSAQGEFTGCPPDEDNLASDVVITVRKVALVQ